VPSWQVATEIAAGRLQRILAAHERDATPVHLVLPPSRLTSPTTRIFADYLVDQWATSRPFADHPRT
jgi:DNA-binding transcriptional LysR family regulator